jgi:hypothetical protein
MWILSKVSLTCGKNEGFSSLWEKIKKLYNQNCKMKEWYLLNNLRKGLGHFPMEHRLNGGKPPKIKYVAVW